MNQKKLFFLHWWYLLRGMGITKIPNQNDWIVIVFGCCNDLSGLVAISSPLAEFLTAR